MSFCIFQEKTCQNKHKLKNFFVCFHADNMKNNKTEPSCLLVVIKTFSCDTDNIYSAVQTLLIV